MREKAEIFFDAVTCVREALVEEAQRHVFRRRSRRPQYLALAACAALAVCLGLFSLLPAGGGGDKAAGGSGVDGSNAAPPPAAADEAPRDPLPEQSPSGEPSPDAPEGAVLTALVREIHDTWLLVEALPDGERFAPGELLEVDASGAAELPALECGDEIAVRFTRAVQEPGAPVRIEGVEEIAMLSGDGEE